MTTIASQITSLTVVYSTVYSDADHRKHQSSASLAFVWGIHRDRWIPRTKGQLRGKCFHLKTSSWEWSVDVIRGMFCGDQIAQEYAIDTVYCLFSPMLFVENLLWWILFWFHPNPIKTDAYFESNINLIFINKICTIEKNPIDRTYT